MLDRGDDQASGLRRSMPRRGGPVLPVAGAGEHPDFVVRLAQALADGGLRVAVVSDFDAVLEQLAQGRPRRGLLGLHSLQAGTGLHRLPAISERSELTLVAVDDTRLARGLALPSSEAVVLAGADTESLATAYARIKAMVGLGSIRDVCALFSRGSGGAPARRGHERLAQTAARFLGVDVAFGGAAPDTSMPSAYRRLADDLALWARGREGATWRPH
ncbi:MAG TPA: hypothetical protein VEA81_01445 [Burkholderiaceae bacterium]|nr:hypothetical protein [Burkholderiaceae bacterium]